MKSRMLSAVSAAAWVCIVFTANAAPQTPDAFLSDIYSHYHGSDSTTAKGVPFDTPAQMGRYLTDDLVALIVADEDAANKRGDIPTLDGDIFADSQEWDITNINIHVDSQSATAAKATVTFDNFKDHKILHYDLVHTPKGWRIFDLIDAQGSFRGLYKKK